MKNQEELFRELGDMIKATKEGKIDWTVEVQTTETNDAAKKNGRRGRRHQVDRR